MPLRKTEVLVLRLPGASVIRTIKVKSKMNSAIRKLIEDDHGTVIACLAYENPAAGNIYRRLGFQEVGRIAVFSK